MADLLATRVGDHLRHHGAEDQKDEKSSVEWRLLRHLLPEALDPVIRGELNYLDALPGWATVNDASSLKFIRRQIELRVDIEIQAVLIPARTPDR